jgi:PKD repeat protein
MTTKLSEITTQYRSFVNDQVLTKDQLNVLINYFEDQDRMSRIYLSGVGIACGFNLTFDEVKKALTISQGTGITTDGDLVKIYVDKDPSSNKEIDIENVTYSYYRSFTDSKALYSFFRKGENQLKIWELLPSQTNYEDSLDHFSDTGLKLEEMVILLYIESFSNIRDLCTSIDCDNQGTEEVSRLRVLMVSASDASYIKSKDPIFLKNDIKNVVYNLPELAMPRIILNSKNTQTYNDLKASYYDAIHNASVNVVEELASSIELIIKNFNLVLNAKIKVGKATSILSILEEASLLKLKKASLEKITKSSVSNKLKEVVNFTKSNVPSDFQYLYDFLKDVIDTYNEIRVLLLFLSKECNPDIKAFPKHLMLGRIDQIESKYKEYRHYFYPSPILNSGFSKVEEFRSLVNRLSKMVDSYEIPQKSIRITPSKAISKLTFRSIPFYYKIDTDFLTSWNYFKTIENKQLTNLSYHQTDLTLPQHVRNPLMFNIDEYDFYRIEGHQGMNYSRAFELINDLKTENSLAFDLKVLSVNPESFDINPDDYQCRFEDLTVLLNAWVAEQECILAEVTSLFSSFSTVDIGKNLMENEFVLVDNYIDLTKNNNLNKSTTDDQAAAASFAKKTVKENLKQSSTVKIAVSRESIVEDNLNLEANSLGAILKKSIEKTETKSVKNIVESANNLVKGTNLSLEPTEIKAVVIDQSITLLAHLHVLAQKIANIQKELTVNSLNEYDVALNEFCVFIKSAKPITKIDKLNEALIENIEKNMVQLNSICCSEEKLEILLEEINRRKAEILLQIQLLKFAEQHPGLEHIAGVKPGGTFIMVYLNSISPTKATGIQNGTIVADFSLPYLCCSSCSPINFIMPRPMYTLQLETDHICLGKKDEILKFDVTPEDGIIMAKPEIKGVKIEGTKLRILASEFPADVFGSPIRFTVNDQLTNCVLTVYQAPQFDFKIPELPATEPNIIFIPEGIPEGCSFLWLFGDGDASTETSPIHEYNLSEIEDNCVTVALTVTAPNGICQQTIVHDIVFESKISLSFNSDHVCLGKDDEELTFIVSPADGKIKAIPEIKGIKINGTKLLILAADFPADMFGIPIHFTVNDRDPDCELTVFQAPQFDFKVPESPTSETIIKFNPVGKPEGCRFKWDFGDGVTSDETSPTHEYDLTKLRGNNVTVTLVVIGSGEHCVQTIQHDIVFEKVVVSLILDTDNICLGTSDETLSFVVTPKNGVIKAKPDIGGVKIEETKLMISAADFPVNMFGSPISFTVNDQETKCELTVYQAPQFDFKVPESPTSETKITFTPVGKPKGCKFKWDFGDGVTSEETSPTHEYDLSKIDGDKVTVTLVVTRFDGYCGQTIGHEIVFEIVEVKCNEKTSALITADQASINLTANIKEELRISILEPEYQLYSQITKQVNDYLNGLKNSVLNDMFSPLLLKTPSILIEIYNGDSYTFNEISKLYTLQIKLFYNVLRCQPEITSAEINYILTVIDSIENGLAQLKERKIKFDNDGILIAFLTEFSKIENLIQTIKDRVNHQIVLLN